MQQFQKIREFTRLGKIGRYKGVFYNEPRTQKFLGQTDSFDEYQARFPAVTDGTG